jgi:hypothetical protein
MKKNKKIENMVFDAIHDEIMKLRIELAGANNISGGNINEKLYKLDINIWDKVERALTQK